MESFMNITVKICGITRLEDAMAAVEAGADWLGFMLYEKSPRAVTLGQVEQIATQLPAAIMRVGVFVDPAEELVWEAIEAGVNALQFHGEESPEFCHKFGLKTIKAFRVRDASSLIPLSAYETEAWLLDSYVPGKLGGTGAKFNWALATEAKKLGNSIILAGGLTPDNVRDAVAMVRPFAVDVSSGVEMAPGKKDHGKMKAFVEAARAGASRTR
jgi:phosphoribosylanthranilate isomerase